MARAMRRLVLDSNGELHAISREDPSPPYLARLVRTTRNRLHLKEAFQMTSHIHRSRWTVVSGFFCRSAFPTAFAVASATSAMGCGAVAQPDGDVGAVSQAFGHYDLVSSYTGSIPETRGWIIEWRIPQLLNPNDAVGVVGQWYYNLESGVYHTGDGWFVYYFGDDNGLAGNEPNCNSMWGSGGTCGGVFSNLQAGQQLIFKYEWCTSSHAASVNGTQLCLYVDLKDGSGYRFLAEDARTTVEMYAHDIEHFASDGFVTPQVSCSAPTRMVRQQRKTTSGSWVNMSGANTWSFSEVSPYVYQNKQLTASPASWESCGGGGSGGACSGVTPWDPAKPWYNYAVGERHTGSNNQLYECNTPSYCYLDPAGPHGSFGWTNRGPC
jgi:hypothetical protein